MRQARQQLTVGWRAEMSEHNTVTASRSDLTSDERQELIRLRRQVAEFRAIYREAVMDGMEADQLMIRVSKVEDLK
jgi:hypothetical protein